MYDLGLIALGPQASVSNCSTAALPPSPQFQPLGYQQQCVPQPFQFQPQPSPGGVYHTQQYFQPQLSPFTGAGAPASVFQQQAPAALPQPGPSTTGAGAPADVFQHLAPAAQPQPGPCAGAPAGVFQHQAPAAQPQPGPFTGAGAPAGGVFQHLAPAAQPQPGPSNAVGAPAGVFQHQAPAAQPQPGPSTGAGAPAGVFQHQEAQVPTAAPGSSAVQLLPSPSGPVSAGVSTSRACEMCREENPDGNLPCGHDICETCFHLQLRRSGVCPSPRCTYTLVESSFKKVLLYSAIKHHKDFQPYLVRPMHGAILACLSSVSKDPI
ncbi:hypothetical protein FOCC_FOCC015786 [Frankliniella occidentalis]|nr:hypothetical protein FOCC_FOCC015786 [Frankliniella occidentalis]